MSTDDSAAADPTARSAMATWLQRRGPWVVLPVVTIALGVWGFLR